MVNGEAIFWWGLAAAVAMLVAFLGLILLAMVVAVWRSLFKKPMPEPTFDAELQRMVEAARRGGSHPEDFE